MTMVFLLVLAAFFVYAANVVFMIYIVSQVQKKEAKTDALEKRKEEEGE